MTEFDIIKNYFAKQIVNRPDVIHGIGDDTAIVSAPTGQTLAITTDTLVNGVHFPEATSPYDIGHKSLAVNLSDLAAMGATPAWVTLAVTLPKVDKPWIQAFCDGFFALANQHHVQLIGGDMTHGPLSITVQAMGLLPTGAALLRSQAKPGDLIYVSGTLGDAGFALAFLQKKLSLNTNIQPAILSRLNQPEPRVELGKQLLSYAHSAIDISDGLAADLSHILAASQVGATINIDKLPLSPELKNTLSHEKAIALALTAGDDYELCFTVPANKKIALENAVASIPCHITCIGEITNTPGLNLHDENGNPYHGSINGYQHF